MSSLLVASPSPMASPMSEATTIKSQRHTRMEKKAYNPQDTPIFETTSDPSLIAHYATAQFNPDVHLTFKPEVATKKIYTDDLGLDSDEVISPVGAVLPFALFSQEAIDIMRWEISRPEILAKYATASNLGKCYIRGYAKDSCPFTYAAWTHPKTAEIVSQQAGIPLEVVFDYEVAHCNLAVEDKDAASSTPGSTTPVVGWHFDSYPFVCVLMLSETADMEGGETCLRNEFGEDLKVEDPKRGNATVLQGRYIEHFASRPQSGKERITMVTSYRPRSPFVKDDSVLTTVRPISDLSELYTDWCEYRMARIEQQLNRFKKLIRADRSNGKLFDLERAVEQLAGCENYLKDTYEQMCESVPISDS